MHLNFSVEGCLLRPAVPAWLQIQLEKLTASFQEMPDDLRQHFAVDGEPMLGESPLGMSPALRPAFRRTTGFALPERPSLSSSGAQPWLDMRLRSRFAMTLGSMEQTFH